MIAQMFLVSYTLRVTQFIMHALLMII